MIITSLSIKNSLFNIYNSELNSADDKDIIFLLSQKIGFNILCKLSPQSLFSGKNKKKDILNCHLLKCLPSMLSAFAKFTQYKFYCGYLKIRAGIIFK